LRNEIQRLLFKRKTQLHSETTRGQRLQKSLEHRKNLKRMLLDIWRIKHSSVITSSDQQSNNIFQRNWVDRQPSKTRFRHPDSDNIAKIEWI